MRCGRAAEVRESVVRQYRCDAADRPGATVRWHEQSAVWTGEVKEEDGAALVVQCTGGTDTVRIARVRTTVLCGADAGPMSSADAAMVQGVIEALRGESGHYRTSCFLSPEDALAAAADAVALTSSGMRQGGTGQGTALRRDGALRGDETRWLPKDGSLPPGIQRLVDRCNVLQGCAAAARGHGAAAEGSRHAAPAPAARLLAAACAVSGRRERLREAPRREAERPN
eukprot:TRINITY_DN9477_c0_g1_i1.p1 TRINITY_DN9477_c0_g1~~TRINITY_DN9477_c0_g1_i1.p1  ORF type:complete len:250 (+),score=68.19 TRINITY_DN9477_c0_g1_i1:70-750(+)